MMFFCQLLPDQTDGCGDNDGMLPLPYDYYYGHYYDY
jgi:hypothetical protein